MIETVSIAPIFALSALFFAIVTVFVYFFIMYMLFWFILHAFSKLFRPIYLIIIR